MGLSSREARLVEALLRHPEGLTADGLAGRLGVSARTVHRDLRPAAAYLESRGLTLERRTGLGLRVEGGDEARERALDELRDAPSTALTPYERRDHLLRALLGSGEPVKLRALASRMKVAVGTVTRDLDEVEGWLAEFRIELVRRRGYGVEVLGPEDDLRRAMAHLILVGPEAAPSSRETPGLDAVSRRLLGLVDEDRLRRVRGLVEEAAERLPYAIADSAFVGLSVHAALMVERLLRGETVEVEAETLDRLSESNEHEHAAALASEVEREFGIEVPAGEVAYLTTHLRGAKLRQDEALAGYEGADLEVASRVKALIHYVEDQTGVPLAGDGSLYAGLLAHLERAIYRLREDLRIHNPLLAEIRDDYPALFDLVGQGLQKTFTEEIPEEETGFVAMHFGAALDRGQESLPRHVLTICAAGIGSAKMLASRLERAFPQIRTIRNASSFELDGIELGAFDLVVSTVPLPLPDEAYVRVQPLLSEAEVGKIKAHIRGRTLEARLADRAASESLEVFGGGQSRFHQMAEATQTIAELIDDVFLARHEAGGSVEEAVRLVCGALSGRGVVTDSERLGAALTARMELGGVGIPETTLALFHARDASVSRPAFSVHEFDEPLALEGMDGEAMRVRRGLLMVAPPELSPVALEAISEISVAMVERPAERDAFETGSEARIAEVLQGIFARFLKHKLS